MIDIRKSKRPKASCCSEHLLVPKPDVGEYGFKLAPRRKVAEKVKDAEHEYDLNVRDAFPPLLF